MCRLLQVTPNNQCNGSLAVFEKMIKNDSTDMHGWLISLASLGMVAVVLLISTVILVCRRNMRHAKNTERLCEDGSWSDYLMLP